MEKKVFLKKKSLDLLNDPPISISYLSNSFAELSFVWFLMPAKKDAKYRNQFKQETGGGDPYYTNINKKLNSRLQFCEIQKLRFHFVADIPSSTTMTLTGKATHIVTICESVFSCREVCVIKANDWHWGNPYINRWTMICGRLHTTIETMWLVGCLLALFVLRHIKPFQVI